MTYLAGQTATVDVGPITDVRTGNPFDPSSLKVKVTAPNGDVTDLTGDIVDVEDKLGRFYVNIPLPSPTILRGKWTWGSGDDIGAESFTLIATEETALASVEDIQARIGNPTPTDVEITQILALLSSATGLVLDAAGKDQEWLAAQDSFSPILRTMCIELVARVAQNPGGLRSTQEQLGAHLYSQTHGDTTGLALSDAEERRIRRAINGSNTASSRGESLADGLAVNYPVDTIEQWI